jgi:NADPH:quinone reductase-like Zn-dependent oxidoreductase
MKAIVRHAYGSPDVLALEEIAKPAPADDEVLVKVHAASVNAGDWHLLRGDPFFMRFAFGVRKPTIEVLGADVAGRVEAVGAKVAKFQPGDEVFGDVSGHGFGAFAEYVCAPEDAFVTKPAGATFEEAAAMPAACVTALQAVRDHGRIQSGNKVLINGASGGVGMFAVQLGKAFGGEVTAVCSTKKIGMVRSLGPDHVIDYTTHDFTHGGQRYDLIVDAAGFRSVFDYKDALSANGVCVYVGGSTSGFLQVALLGPLLSKAGGPEITTFIAKPSPEDLATVKELFESDQVKPIIDTTYPLHEVPEAIRHLEQRRTRGKVVIQI